MTQALVTNAKKEKENLVKKINSYITHWQNWSEIIQISQRWIWTGLTESAQI